MPYKISGNLSDNCNVKVFQGNEYVGYLDVTGSTHEVIFDLTSSGTVTVVGEKSDGEVVGYGNVTPVSTGDSTNIISAAAGAVIKSIQVVEPTKMPDSKWNPENEVKDHTISSVDTNKTILMNVGSYDVVASAPDNSMIRAELINSTTVRLTRHEYKDPGWIYYYFTVLEFESGIKSIQRGTSAPGTVAISEVDVDKTIVNILNASSTQTSYDIWEGGRMTNNRGYLNSSTEIQLYGHSSNTISYEVIEFE